MYVTTKDVTPDLLRSILEDYKGTATQNGISQMSKPILENEELFVQLYTACLFSYPNLVHMSSISIGIAIGLRLANRINEIWELEKIHG